MPNHKLCGRCGEVKAASEFSLNAGRQDGLQVYCRPCFAEYRKDKQSGYNARWYAKNAEAQRKAASERYYANPEPVRARRRKANRDPEEYARHVADMLARAKRNKARVFAHYGISCACCGESNPGFLTIDHINGCTKEERKAQGLGAAFYRWLCTNGFPEGFRTLCAGCNLARASNKGICPHESEKINVTVHHRRTKARVFAHYGHRCVCCGESNPGFLSIDHVNGCGGELRKIHGTGAKLYRWLCANDFPEGFQTLCINCNLGRARNGGICPHKTDNPAFEPAPPPPEDDVFRLIG